MANLKDFVIDHNVNNTFIDRKSLKSEVASSIPFPVQLSIVVQSLARE